MQVFSHQDGVPVPFHIKTPERAQRPLPSKYVALPCVPAADGRGFLVYIALCRFAAVLRLDEVILLYGGEGVSGADGRQAS
jgi:hypothetical protein